MDWWVVFEQLQAPVCLLTRGGQFLGHLQRRSNEKADPAEYIQIRRSSFTDGPGGSSPKRRQSMLSAGDAGLLGDTAARLLGRERRLGLVSAPWRTSNQDSNRAPFRRQGERWHIFATCMTEDGP